MDPQEAIDLGRQAIVMTLIISAPALAVGLIVGLIVGMAQALTQIQDQTVSFVPKLVAMVVALGFCLPWLIQRLTEYTHDLIADIPRVIMGG